MHIVMVRNGFPSSRVRPVVIDRTSRRVYPKPFGIPVHHQKAPNRRQPDCRDQSSDRNQELYSYAKLVHSIKHREAKSERVVLDESVPESFAFTVIVLPSKPMRALSPAPHGSPGMRVRIGFCQTSRSSCATRPRSLGWNHWTVEKKSAGPYGRASNEAATPSHESRVFHFSRSDGGRKYIGFHLPASERRSVPRVIHRCGRREDQ